MKKIAIVEDEADLRDLLKLHITREGFEPVPFQNGDSFLDFIRQGQVDLVLLDIMLPGTDGLSICRILRSEDKTRNLPIVLLTAKGTELDIVVGLELGADDYITKPFSTRELIARVKSLFRRLERIDQEKSLKLGSIEVYPDRVEVFSDGKSVDLTTTEFKILETLLRRRGRVLTRGQILDILGDDRQFVLDRTVDVHVLNIRRKLGDNGKHIITIRGIGYKIVDDSMPSGMEYEY